MIRKTVRKVRTILQGKGVITASAVLGNAIVLSAVHEKGKIKIYGI